MGSHRHSHRTPESMAGRRVLFWGNDPEPLGTKGVVGEVSQIISLIQHGAC